MSNVQKYSDLPLDKVRIDDGFWSACQKLVRDVVLPYQWEALNDRVPDAEPSHSIKNLKIAAGLEEGPFKGPYFQDSDVAKWLEAVAYSLHTHPDAALEKTAGEAIRLVGRAQRPDGYLNSYVTATSGAKRWGNLHECHELYVAGHFIEAGVAWYQATGRRDLLDIVCRIADNIDAAFGPEPEKSKGYDGHEEIELALARLYEATGEERYLSLSRFFLEIRGSEPYYFTAEWEKRGRVSAWTGNPSENPAKNREYNQAHLPVREQRTAAGHAVRQAYLLTGMADVAMKTGDEAMLEACRAVWEDIVRRQMYITGGIGSSRSGEAFTFDYDLPNDTVYAETCATIGLIFFAQKMLQTENKREYADVIEKALFNLIVGSLSGDGKHYFYVNPLEVWPEASLKNPSRMHVKPVRQKWFGCACCPPNLARMLSSLGKYIYTAGEDELIVHQFIGSEASVNLAAGKLTLRQSSDYPWGGDIRFDISVPKPVECTLSIRIPGWCTSASLSINGKEAKPVSAGPGGYARIKRLWQGGDAVSLHLDMPVVLMEANPLVRADAGKVAIQRGPVVYCLEEADCGANLSALSLAVQGKLSIVRDAAVLNGIPAVKGIALRDEQWDDGGLYRPAQSKALPVPFRAVPYCLWGNREPGEMIVWVRKA